MQVVATEQFEQLQKELYFYKRSSRELRRRIRDMQPRGDSAPALRGMDVGAEVSEVEG